MKRVNILLVLVLSLALASCGSDSGSSNTLAGTPSAAYAAVGNEDTLIVFNKHPGGLIYYSDRAQNCDFESGNLCEDMYKADAATAPVRDSYSTTTSQTHVQLEYRNQKTNFSLPTLSGRDGHQVVAFDDKLFVIGGVSKDSHYYGSVWSSFNGLVWKQETTSDIIQEELDIQILSVDPDVELPRLQHHQVVEFNDDLYLIGGQDDEGNTKNDVWKSRNGANWQEVTSDANFGYRRSHQVVEFNDDLYLIGGQDDEGNTKNDVWMSSNGTIWDDVTLDANFSARRHHQVVVFKGTGDEEEKLYLIGGSSGGSGDDTSDVWKSADGGTWNLVEASSDFGERRNHQVVAFNGKMYLIGGEVYDDGEYYSQNDIWESADGQTWEEVDITGDIFPHRRHHQVTVFNDKLYLIGGSYNDDVWSSQDGKIWTKVIGKFEPRHQHQMTAFKGRLYLSGGRVGSDDTARSKKDVWSSQDGFVWKQETPNADFSERRGHQITVFNNELYLIGGIEEGNELKNDVWTSSNGVEWNKVIENADFSSRHEHQVVVFDDKLYLIGGDASGDPRDATSDVWCSSNGIIWQNVTDDASFDKRKSHQVVVLNDKMWLIGGGSDQGQSLYNDVWYSSDGITWQEATGDAEFFSRQHHQVVVFKDNMYLIGGSRTCCGGPGELNGVWRSSNGIKWTKIADESSFDPASAQTIPESAFSPRRSHQVSVLNGVMYLTAGMTNSMRMGVRDANDVWASEDGIHWRRLEYIPKLHWVDK